MAIVRDASSPSTSTSGNLTSNGTNSSGTSASFSPPANTWITITAFVDSTGGALTWTPSNTGTALSWTLIKNQINAGGGGAVAYRAFNINAQTGITVSLSVNNGGTSGQIDGAFWVDVWTGADSSQTGASANSGTSASTNFNGTVTTTRTGSQVIGVGCDDNGSNTPSSTDTFNQANAGTHADGLRAYKASNSGAPGSVSVNFQAASTPIWSWIAFELLAPAGNVSVNLTGQTATFSQGTIAETVSYGLTAQTVTSSEGTLSDAVSYGLTAQSATFSEGTITPAIAAVLTAQTATFTEGTVGLEIDYALTGQTATFTEGSITASVGGNVTVTLSGQTATFAAGAIGPEVDYSLTGQSISLTEGTPTTTVSYGLSQQTGTFTEGTITVQAGGDVSIQLGSLQSVFSLGQITVTGADARTQDAGRRRLIRSIYRITIDGQTFECSTLQEALDLLAKAKEIAVQKAPEIVKPGIPPALPVITANTRELRPAITETKREIAKVYRQALIDAEIAMLMELDDRSKHNDDMITFLM